MIQRRDPYNGLREPACLLFSVIMSCGGSALSSVMADAPAEVVAILMRRRPKCRVVLGDDGNPASLVIGCQKTEQDRKTDDVTRTTTHAVSRDQRQRIR